MFTIDKITVQIGQKIFSQKTKKYLKVQACKISYYQLFRKGYY